MIVVLSIYHAGWGDTNIHTYTYDYGVIFNLVDDETGESGEIVINVDGDDENNIASLTYYNNILSLHPGDTLSLGSLDANNLSYRLIATTESGTTITYNNSTWTYDAITFTSSNSSAATISSDGTITVPKTAPVTSVVITATYGNIITNLVLNILEPELSYIGFAPSTSSDDVDITAVDDDGNNRFISTTEIFNTHSVTNTTNGYYLWILTNDKITSVMTDSFSVPIVQAEPIGDFTYCYYCPNALIATNVNLNIS